MTKTFGTYNQNERIGINMKATGGYHYEVHAPIEDINDIHLCPACGYVRQVNDLWLCQDCSKLGHTQCLHTPEWIRWSKALYLNWAGDRADQDVLDRFDRILAKAQTLCQHDRTAPVARVMRDDGHYDTVDTEVCLCCGVKLPLEIPFKF